MNSYMADVNVLVALSLAAHPHAIAVHEWYQHERKPCLQVCRLVQLGFLRVLTTQSVAGTGTLTNSAAFNLYSRLLRQDLLKFHSEPVALDTLLADRASLNRSSPKVWADAYLSAFASHARLRLVTFDRALASYTPGSILLASS